MKKKLLILPYMTARVQDLLEEEPEKMKELHLKCCKFYKDALINKLVSVCSSPSLIFCFRMWKKGNFDIAEFTNIEPNIWACLYRAINKKRVNLEFDEE